MKQVALKSTSWEALLYYVAVLKTHFGPETISGNWKPFKNDEKCFLIYPKSSFFS